MTTRIKSVAAQKLQNELYLLKTLVYDKCGLNLYELSEDFESKEYGACSFSLNRMKIKFRISKITPTKTGQFVTMWKRNKDGVTQPFEESDEIDFVIICSRSRGDFGQFIFLKSVLIEKRIITRGKKTGKLGIRVYPPWDKVNSKQAQITKDWQIKYFFKISKEETIDLNGIENIFGSCSKIN